MSEHLTPEQFVDLLEGSPVEAEARRHFLSCLECRAELRELSGTLGILRRTTAAPRARRKYAIGAVAAAAVLAAAVFLYRSAPVSAPGPAAEIPILPPIEADRDYQLLEALSRDLAADDAIAGPLLDLPDPSELTSPELRDLLGRLTREMGSTS